jgi:hypothetical protein
VGEEMEKTEMAVGAAAIGKSGRLTFSLSSDPRGPPLEGGLHGCFRVLSILVMMSSNSIDTGYMCLSLHIKQGVE